MGKRTTLGFGPRVCGTLDEGASREWLVPDGCGGFALGTVSGLRTRRYHCLLAVADESCASRMVGLVSLDPVLVTETGAEVRLAIHEWASGAIAPEGHTLLQSFTLEDGLPRWRWRVGDIVVERELAMAHGRPALGVVHRLVSGGPARLRLEALCTWRDCHGARFAVDGDLETEAVADGAVVERAFRLRGPGWEPAGVWWRDAWLREEAARGLGAREDLWFAGAFHADLQPGESLEVSAWAGDLDAPPPPAAAVVAEARRRARALTAKAGDDTEAHLLRAADAFVVKPGGTAAGRVDVVAGYPWFGAWSRDTMLSYEGLFLASDRADEGRELLRGYAATLSEGMLANTADTGSVEYNSADATLWFVHAIGRHTARTGDTDLAAELAPGLEEIVKAHLAGTRYGIRVDPADGLLAQGAEGLALTWMDARIDGVPVTARAGKAVEINALWINALGTVCDLWDHLGRDGSGPRRSLEQATEAFRRRFPTPWGGLFDVLDTPGGSHDPALRPNQLLAYSLPHAPLRGQAPPEAVGRELLTPLGLRTLAPADPRYRAAHRGSPAERDAAYHQGTVWPWLIGPYHDALAAFGAPRDSAGPLEGLLDGIEAHLDEAGLGSVSETADGRAPHGTTGCPFQAWSVAEALRVRKGVTH